MAVNARWLPSLGLLLALTGCTHGEYSKAAPATTSPTALPSSSSVSIRCGGPPPLREGPAALAVMRKSQRDGMHPYLRLARGRQVLALVPSNVRQFTVRVGGDAGVLTPLGQEPSAKGGTLLRFAVADSGSASIDAISTSGGTESHYVAGVTAAC